MREIIEAAAHALYERERQRGEHAKRVFSKAAGKPTRGLDMEPWEECADMYRADAEAALDAACDAIGWPEIRAYQAELRRGQDVYEDAGGFFARAIRALFGKPGLNPVLTYQEAARAMIREAGTK